MQKFYVIFWSVQQLSIHPQLSEPENVLEAKLYKTTAIEHGAVP